MADAVVSLILDQLKTIIIDKAKEQVKLLVGVKEEVEKLERNLDLINSVLADAEVKKRTDDLVKKWLDRLKQASYDMEDVLDEWRIVVEMEVHGADNIAARCQRKVLSNFISCFSFPRMDRLRSRHEIAQNIKQINERLDDIAKEKDRYQLISKKIELPKLPESSSFVDVSKICGRDGVKEKIKSYLWGENSEEEAGELIQTISIVGMGGLGKTALAQLLFNDHGVKQHFDKIIWVCVSDLFVEKKVAKAIIQGLEGISGSAALGLELEPLQVLLERISNSIKGKKFLLILDDVWDGDKGERWDSLKVTFKNGAPGSRILVTTRDVRVAEMMGSSSSHIIHLEKLGDEECWSILKHIALGEREDKTMEEIGKKIANRCKGLPLAAKVLGGLLRSKSRQQWQSILSSEMWQLPLAQKNIFTPLLLSYYDLPPPIRQCFLFCGVYPKDFEYFDSYITTKWMAQGYLGSNIGDADLESIGHEYFHILGARSFFQDFRVDDGKTICKMHDLVHDFALYLADNEFMTKELGDSGHFNIDSTKHRHLTVMVNGPSFPTSISGAEKLRTLQVFTKDGAFTPEAMRSLFNRCRRLRILDFNWSHVCKEIPKEIGKLLHLRYLDLSSTQLGRLPESISNIRNLEFLCLNNCQNLKQLPEWITKLINLRYLATAGCFGLTHYPKFIRKLTALRSLIGAIVRADCNDAEEFSLADLGNLRHLRRVIMKVVGDSIDREEARKAELPNIQQVHIYLAAPIGEDDIIEALGLPSDIKLYFHDNFWPS